jgi:hypothetical protein
MQEILGRILAGEIQEPGSFSPYTLEAVARLDQITAQAFQFIVSRALITPNSWHTVIVSILAEDGAHIETLLDGGQILHLSSCGLLTPLGASHIEPERFLYLFGSTPGSQRVAFEKDQTTPAKNLMMPMKGDFVLLTQAGAQLQSIIPKTFDVAYARQLQSGLSRIGVRLTFLDINVDARRGNNEVADG